MTIWVCCFSFYLRKVYTSTGLAAHPGKQHVRPERHRRGLHSGRGRTTTGGRLEQICASAPPRGGDGKEWRRIRAGAAREGRRGAAPGSGGRRRALPGHQRGHPSRQPYNPSRQHGPKPDARQGKGTAAGTPAAGEQQMQANNSGSTGSLFHSKPPLKQEKKR